MRTLVDLLDEAAEKHTGKIAVSARVGLREDPWTYLTLRNRSCAIAQFLRESAHLSPGERVVVWGPNCPEMVAVYFGVMASELILVPLDPSSTFEFITRVVEKTQASALIAGFPPPPLSGLPVLLLRDLPAQYDSKSSILDRPEPEAIAEIVFTSGTTGVPKGVVLTHRNIIANVVSAQSIVPRNSRYRLLSLLPLSHMLEQTVGLFVPLVYGNTIFYPPSRQSPVVLKALKRYRIVTAVVVPQILRLILRGIEREVQVEGRVAAWKRAHKIAPALPMRMRRWLFRRVHRELGGALQFFMCGGASLPSDLSLAWERMGVRVVEGYGATECSPIVASNTLARRLPGSVGRPVPGVHVRLSQANEILVKGDNVTPGYWNDPDATNAAFDDGWYRTGDLAEEDRSGNYRIRGRLRDLVVLSSGLKVHPDDVEPALKEEDGIADCVVTGQADASGEVRVHAVVIPSDNRSESVDERVSQAIRRANTRLAPHQRVAGFTIWPRSEFPRTNLQKVKRYEVSAALKRQPTQPAAVTVVPSPQRDMRARLRTILAEISGIREDAMTPESDLALDLKFDSLSCTELAIRLEEELGLSVDEPELEAAGTVGRLGDLLEQSRPRARAVPFPRWPLSWPARATRMLLQSTLVLPVHRLSCRPFRVEGREHLESVRGPVLFIANHSSHLDTPSLIRALPRSVRNRIAVAAAADYFYRGRIMGAAASLALNTFPFYREGPVRASLEHCGELVDDGWSILVYPEGTRSTTGDLHAFKSGVGLLATGLRIPVIPTAIFGTYRILPKGQTRPRPGPVTVRFGDKVEVPPNADPAAVTHRLEEAVARLIQYAAQ